jgi:hypothetical protein
MDVTWWLRGLAGGALIGASASVLLLVNGRVAGISGIVGGLLGRAEPAEHAWRALFVLGLVVGGALAAALVPGARDAVPPTLGTALVAGALVGIGTRLGNGCTSGHGVCGLSRLSVRSLVATLTFLGTGAVGVLAARGAGVGP